MYKYLLILIIVGCARPGEVDNTDPDVARLDRLEDAILEWATPCTFQGRDYPCERDLYNTNEDHVTLWAGVSCLAGLEEYCLPPEILQSEDGRLWRSPSQVNKKTKNPSSRDMLTGWLAGLVVVKSAAPITRFLQYLESHENSMCPDADDNRCDMSPNIYKATWGTIKVVMQHLGMEIPEVVSQASTLDSSVLLIEAKTSPVGYQLHLVAIQLHIRKRVGVWNSILQTAADTLAKKDPDNAYFEWLSNGVTRKAVDLVLQRCPAVPGIKQNEWIWSQGVNPTGFDCLSTIEILRNNK